MYIRVADTAILIDAGKNAKCLCAALQEIGSDIQEIRAIFVTHDHSDHISALSTLTKKHQIPVHMTAPSARIFDKGGTKPIHSCLKRHTPIYTVQIDDITVTSFVTPHDSVMSVGYRIEFCDGDKKRAIGVATDMGYASEDVKAGLLGCEAVIIECNHDIEMLRTGPYHELLKRRVMSKEGHLSNEACAALAAYLSENGTKAFLLAHLSRENNTPELAISEVRGAVPDESIFIDIASPDIPTEIPLWR